LSREKKDAREELGAREERSEGLVGCPFVRQGKGMKKRRCRPSGGEEIIGGGGEDFLGNSDRKTFDNQANRGPT